VRTRPDAELVLAIRAGDASAFDALHGRYAALLQRYARRLLGARSALAEDLVQETFERAYRALLRDEREIMLGAWLHTLLRNRCLDELRRTRPAALELIDEIVEAPAGDPLAILERRQTVSELLSRIAALPARQRAALLGLVLGGLAHEAIAADLGTSVAATKSLVSRARDNLARRS
jgi:RNA polymerase sigma-70 factor, ECF subfamily